MAWQDTLLDASFREVPFEVEETSRAGSRAISANEFPYVAGAAMEDMNLRPREVHVRAVFWGEGYEDRLHAFVLALEAPGPGYLIHPVHGGMTVLAAQWDDRHEAEFEGAALTVLFVESKTREVGPFSGASASSKADAVATRAATARSAANDALAARVEAVPRSAWQRITVLKDGFNQVKTRLRGLLSVTSTAKALVSDLDPILYPRAYAADLVAVVDQALQGLPFGGRNLLYAGNDTSSGSGLGDWDRARRALDPSLIALVPVLPVPNATMLADLAVAQAHGRAHAATAIAECAAIVLAGELEESLLDRADIEAVSNQARAALQVAIDGARAALDAEGRAAVGQSLRDLAWQVQEAARAVVNQRPPLVRRTAPIGGPVRLVAHALHGDASRAPELARLNRLGRHVLIQAGEELNAYAH